MEDEDKAELVKKAHRRVFEAISKLVDVVEEPFLLETLHLLDAGSWNEVIEERYLANSCGFPTCSSVVQRQNLTGRRYKFDRKETKIYTAIPQYEKFCSTECYERSCNVQHQLYEEPLWFHLERRQKEYSIEIDSNKRDQKPRRPEDIFVAETDKFLLTRLNEMKIADNVESSEEDDEEGEKDENTATKKRKEEDDKFLNEIRSFVTSVAQMTTKSNSNAMGFNSKAAVSKPPRHMPTGKQNEPEMSTKENGDLKTDQIQPKQRLLTVSTNQTQKSQTPTKNPIENKQMDEKLEKLRQKYGKPGQKVKTPPVLIEALPMDPQKAARLAEDLR